MSTIVVLSDSQESSRALDAAFTSTDGHEVVTVGEWLDRPAESTVAILREHGADVVVIVPGPRIAESVGLAGEIEATMPDVAMVLVTDPEPQLLSQAMRVGIREVVAPLTVNQELVPATRRALDIVERRRSVVSSATEAADAHGRIIAIISPKGGSGKTVVATNLAVGLARARPGETVLVDADLQFGDVNTSLRLQPEHSVLDAVRAGVSNATSLKLHLTRHASRLLVLAAPESPAEADEISSADLGKILGLLSESFPFVVVDTDGGLGERTLTVLESATDYVFVCATDVPSVRGLSKALEALDTIGMTTAERHFVLNRADAKVGLDLDDITRTIGRQFDVELPSTRAVPESVNDGNPVLFQEERTPISRPLNDLVERFIAPNGVPEAARRGGLFGRRD